MVYFNLNVLDTIADFLSSIGNFFKSIGDFVVTWFRDLVSAVKLIRESASLITGTGVEGQFTPLSIFPPVIVSIFGAIVIVIILYKVLGREG